MIFWSFSTLCLHGSAFLCIWVYAVELYALLGRVCVPVVKNFSKMGADTTANLNVFFALRYSNYRIVKVKHQIC